jgi:GT2 family glycosyltransferase
MSEKVCIIVLNWNRWMETIACLNSLKRQTYQRTQIIVMDNGSEDDSVQRVNEWLTSNAFSDEERNSKLDEQLVLEYGGQNWTVESQALRHEEIVRWLSQRPKVLLRGHTNLGFAEGCNVALRLALHGDPEYAWVLNNDTEVFPRTLECLLGAAKQTNAGIVSGRVMNSDGTRIAFPKSRSLEHISPGSNQIFESLFSKPFGDSCDVSGASMLLHQRLIKERLSREGYVFDPKFFMYCEDVDLCRYAAGHGHKVMIACDAAVCHGESISTGGSGSYKVFYYITRNRIYLMNKWLQGPRRWLFHAYYVPSRLVLQLYRFFISPSCRVPYAVLRGLIDGYRGTYGKWPLHEA